MQNDAKRDAEILDFSILQRKGDFNQLSVLQPEKHSILRIEGYQMHQNIGNENDKKHLQKWDATKT